MSYNGKTLALYEDTVKDMIEEGYSYTEVSEATGIPVSTIYQRNLVIYKIPVYDAFAARLKRDGWPSRLQVDDSFGWWFSGFFDGAGTLGVSLTKQRYRVNISINQRWGSKKAIQCCRKHLGVGRIEFIKSRGNMQEQYRFKVDHICDLAEVILPLFEKFTLRTKKADEYMYWSKLVRQKYIDTLGGTSLRHSAVTIAVKKDVDAIREIRKDVRWKKRGNVKAGER